MNVCQQKGTYCFNQTPFNTAEKTYPDRWRLKFFHICKNVCKRPRPQSTACQNPWARQFLSTRTPQDLVLLPPMRRIQSQDQSEFPELRGMSFTKIPSDTETASRTKEQYSCHASCAPTGGDLNRKIFYYVNTEMQYPKTNIFSYICGSQKLMSTSIVNANVLLTIITDEES